MVMRAYELQSFGLEGLAVVERPAPLPGPGEVLLRVRAASLNYRDLMTVEGRYNPRLRLPMVPLSDAAGEVEAIGAGVTRFAVGDSAISAMAQRWFSGEPSLEKVRHTLGGQLPGVLAERIVLPQEGLVPVPGDLSLVEAATLPCAALTAWSALVDFGRVKPGDDVLVLGTGGVAVFALQFARLLGARTLVTSRHEWKLARVKPMGVSETIHVTSDSAWEDQVVQLTAGRGADLVVEVGGAGTLSRSLKAARIGGRVAVIGVLAGATSEVDVRPILMKKLTLGGILVGSRESFEDMNRALAEHDVRPVIDKVFPFEETPAALRYLKSGRHVGKICIRV
jgi:NADPH:quinone reductase-like Zn-dependent oxidoreductase